MATTTTETKKAITLVDKSTKQMTAALKSLTTSANDLNGLVEISETLAFDIEARSSELAGIKDSIAIEVRKANAEIELKVSENAEKVLDSLLKERGLARISTEVVNGMVSEIESLKSDNQEAITEAVNSAVRTEAIKYSAEKSKLQSDHAVASAELTATNNALVNKIEFLESQVSTLEGMIEAEREARVKMSENAAQPTINVQSGK